MIRERTERSTCGIKTREPFELDNFERRLDGLPESAKVLLRFARERGLIG